jgi:hypothetical protein
MAEIRLPETGSTGAAEKQITEAPVATGLLNLTNKRTEDQGITTANRTTIMETTLGPETIAKVKAAVRSCPEPSTIENIMAVGGFTDRNTVRGALLVLEERGEISRQGLIPYGDLVDHEETKK